MVHINLATQAALAFIIYLVVLVITIILDFFLIQKRTFRTVGLDRHPTTRSVPFLLFCSFIAIEMAFIMGGGMCLLMDWGGVAKGAMIGITIFAGIVCYWALTHRGIILDGIFLFILLLIFMWIVLIASAVASWSRETWYWTPFKSHVALGAGIAALWFIWFGYLHFAWQRKRWALIPLLFMVITLVFAIILPIVGALGAYGTITEKAVPATSVTTLVLIGIFTTLAWVFENPHIVYFESREEGESEVGARLSLNMFHIMKPKPSDAPDPSMDSYGAGAQKPKLKTKRLGMLAYRKFRDNRVKVGIISVHDWSEASGQGERLLGRFNQIIRKTDWIDVKYRLFVEDDNYKVLSSLCERMGYKVEKETEGGMSFQVYDLLSKVKRKKKASKGEDEKTEQEKEEQRKREQEEEKERERERERRRERDDSWDGYGGKHRGDGRPPPPKIVK